MQWGALEEQPGGQGAGAQGRRVRDKDRGIGMGVLSEAGGLGGQGSRERQALTQVCSGSLWLPYTHQGQAGGPPRWLQHQPRQKQVMTWARLEVEEMGDLVKR